MTSIGLRSSFVAAVFACALTVPASAAVQVSRREIVVSGRGARAVITRSPLRLAFGTGRRTELREFPAHGVARRVGAVADPQPYGLDSTTGPAVYEPLNFEVGTERRDQWTGAYWAGNLLQAVR